MTHQKANSNANQLEKTAMTQEEKRKKAIKKIEEFIEQSIGHLLDFPENPDELREHIKLFKAACEQEVSQENDYHQLRAVLLNPKTYLSGLGRSTQAEEYQLSVSDIIALCLRVVSNHLIEAARTAQVDLVKEECHFQSLYHKILEQTQAEEAFSDEKIPVTHTFEWHQLQLEGDIFAGRLDIEEEIELHADGTEETVNFIILSANITTLYDKVNPPLKIKYDTLKRWAGVREDNVLYSSMPYARRHILQVAFDWVLNDLLEAGLIHNPEREAFLTHKEIYLPFLTNRFYLDAFCKGIIDIDFMSSRNDKINILLNPIVISLLKINPNYLPHVDAINERQLEIAALYINLFKDNKLSVETLINFNNEQCELLKHPLIANLIKKGLLDYRQAITFPLHLKTLFSNSFFNDYLNRLAERNEVDWQAIANLKEYHCEALCSKEGIHAINNNLIAINAFYLMSKLAAKSLMLEQVPQLLTEKIISFSELNLIDEKTFANLNYPEVILWLKKKVIFLRDMPGQPLINLAATALGRRLYALYQQEPKQIHSELDNAKSLFAEYETFCQQRLSRRVGDELLLQSTFTCLMRKIQTQLKTMYYREIPLDEVRAFEEIFETCLAKKPTQPELVFENLLVLAHRQIQKRADAIPSGLSNHKTYSSPDFMKFFREKTKAKPVTLQLFYDKLTVLQDFFQPMSGVLLSAGKKGM